MTTLGDKGQVFSKSFDAAAFYEIKKYKTINYTPVIGIAARAMAELISDGQSEPIVSLFWDDSAIVALHRSKPVGVITWKYQEWSRTVNIHLGYVEKEHRRQGVYCLMWDALVEEAKGLDAATIVGTTHVDNKPMRATAIQLGREEFSINLVYRLDR